MAKKVKARKTRAQKSVHGKFAAIRAEMKAALIERDAEIDMILVGLLAQQNVCFVGPPGTAKSMMLDALCSRIEGDASSFRYLMTKHTSPDELFGPVSPKGLCEDRLHRISKGYLPDATVAFLDEFFKSSSAAINMLLNAFNERTFKDDGQDIAMPLKMVVVASNEWPGQNGSSADELGAAFDRLLLRKSVKPITSRKGMRRLLTDGESFDAAAGTKFSVADLDSAIAEITAITIPETIDTMIDEIINDLVANGIDIRQSSRRLLLGLKLVKAAAWMNGHASVEPSDLDVLKFAWWVSPAQETKCHQIIASKANPTQAAALDMMNQADDVVESFTREAQLADSSDTGMGRAQRRIEAIGKLTTLILGDDTKRPCLKNLDQDDPDVANAREYIADLVAKLQGSLVGVDVGL